MGGHRACRLVDADGELVGILSEADLLARVEDDEHRHPRWVEALMSAGKLAQEFVKLHGKKVSEVMSTNVVSASEDTPVSEIAASLERHRIKRVPIVANGKVVGKKIGEHLARFRQINMRLSSGHRGDRWRLHDLRGAPGRRLTGRVLPCAYRRIQKRPAPGTST